MTGKRYYMTTLGDWQRHAARFATSHFIVLDMPATESAGAQHALLGAGPSECNNLLDPAIENAASIFPENEDSQEHDRSEFSEQRQALSPGLPGARLPTGQGQADMACHARTKETPSPDGGARILALIEADEGVHLALDDDSAFEALPHPLAQKPISDAAQSALAAHGVVPGATTFDAAEAVARAHPLLRHRVF